MDIILYSHFSIFKFGLGIKLLKYDYFFLKEEMIIVKATILVAIKIEILSHVLKNGNVGNGVLFFSYDALLGVSTSAGQPLSKSRWSAENKLHFSFVDFFVSFWLFFSFVFGQGIFFLMFCLFALIFIILMVCVCVQDLRVGRKAKHDKNILYGIKS